MSLSLLAILVGLAPGPSVTIRVEAKPDHAISPYIYGASAVSPADVGLPGRGLEGDAVRPSASSS